MNMIRYKIFTRGKKPIRNIFREKLIKKEDFIE